MKSSLPTRRKTPRRNLRAPKSARGRFSCRPGLEQLEERNLLANSSLVFPGGDGNLLYQPDAYANRIEDFSNVGYQGGIMPLPGTKGGVDIPVQVVLDPGTGDQTSRIQAAINQVAGLPFDDNGYRGAVLLRAGEYPISGRLTMNASGVVLLGEGADPTNGTRLRATGTAQRPLIVVNGTGSRQTVGATHNLIDKYVPVGARSFRVDSTDGLSAGDTVVVHRPSPGNWIHDIGMDRLRNPWQPNSRNLDWDRVITRIEGNQITVDAPLTNALEQRYGGGTVFKYTWPGRLENVGLADFFAASDSTGPRDQNHATTALQMDTVENAWVRNVTAAGFAQNVYTLGGGTKWVTLDSLQSLDTSITGGAPPSGFLTSAQLTLIKNSHVRSGYHAIALGAQVAGPNVFVDFLADGRGAEVGPHQRWSTGGLFDNVSIRGTTLAVRNRGNSGTGHGWTGANYVIWNSSTDRALQVFNPPTAQNWVIGGFSPSPQGTGIFDSFGTAVEPRSLYYQQLAERQAFPGLDKREYWLGDIDNFTLGDPEDFPYVDPDWLSTIQRAAGSHPVVGFDDLRSEHKWIPFTFTFDLAPGEQVFSASLSLAMRGTGSVREDDRIYLGSLGNSYRFDDLGWTPIPTTGSSPRVFDLSGQTDLLQGGQLNVAVQDDVAVDWAVLNFQVAPMGGVNAPTFLILPQFDALAVEPIASEVKQATPLLWATTQKPSQSAPMPTHTEDQAQIPANHATAGGEAAVRALARMANVHQVATDLLFGGPWRGDIFGAFCCQSEFFALEKGR